MSPCDCPRPELCRALGRHMNAYLLSLWDGQGEAADRFRATALAQAPDQALAAQAALRETPPNCMYLWKRVRDGDGKPLVKACAPCGGKGLDVFFCRCPQRQKGEELDQVTLNDCKTCSYKIAGRPDGAAAWGTNGAAAPFSQVRPRALVFKNHLSPGDILVMTAALRSLHAAHPGRFVTGVDTTCPHLWENNPDLATKEQLDALDGGEMVQTHYDAVNQCNQVGIHFMEAYCRFFAHALQVPVPLAVNRPQIHLSDEEKGWQNGVEQHTGYRGKFWLLSCGHKKDFTNKFWGQDSFQEVVDRLRGRVTFVQVGSLEHVHRPLRGVINFLGKTNLRELVRLCWHAQGVLTGITFLHHLAAALEKPCVTVMGGREPVQWNSYPKCQLLHTIGMLPCCKDGGCWKSRVVRLGDGAEQDQSLCESPTHGDDPVPRCMALIRPETVVRAVESFYDGGVLSN